jgi:hypothetical protein
MTLKKDPLENVEDDEVVGYRRPPKSGRFVKGQSGNPAGRPAGRQTALYEMLDLMVVIREDGRERRVTREKAFLLSLAKRGMDGDIAAARECLGLIRKAKEGRSAEHSQIKAIVREIIRPGSITPALEALRMGRKLDRYRKTTRMALESWLVEAALARLPHQLSSEQQRTILKATRASHKVRWPKWWSQFR